MESDFSTEISEDNAAVPSTFWGEMLRAKIFPEGKVSKNVLLNTPSQEAFGKYVPSKGRSKARKKRDQ